MSSVAEVLREISPRVSMEAKEVLTAMDTLDRYFSRVKIDKGLLTRVYKYQIGYVNTSREYVEFFGSNLLGVHTVRFKESDVLRFFNEVLEIDYLELLADVRKTTVIYHDNSVQGDLFNLTVIYLVHRALSEKSLSEKDRIALAHNTALIFFYRATAAILSAYVRYQADIRTAQAAYANLSYKFLIKRLGSWYKVMDYRASELIAPSGTQYKKLVHLDDDLDLTDIVSDCANAIKDMIKNYYSVLVEVYNQGDRIGTSSMTLTDIEGEEVIADKIRGVDRQIAQIKTYVSDQRAFVRDDLIRVICDINRNTSPRLLKETLFWISGQSHGKEHKLIDEVLSQVIIYSFYLIQTKIEPSKTKDLAFVLVQLKNLYLSSRSTDQDLVKIRELIDRILLKAHKKLSEPLKLATRTALILYVTLLVLASKNK